MKAREAVAPYWYAPERFQNEGKPPKFRLRPLTSLEWLDVQRESQRLESVGATIWDGQSVRTILGPALLGWENITDVNGTDQPSKFLGRPDIDLPKLDWRLVLELCSEVIANTKFDEGDERNSPSQSR